MILRTPSDIIYAVNAARDLTNLVVSYLHLWKKYANGINNVFIPDEKFTVVFCRVSKENYLCVSLVFTKTVHWEEPNYYDVDSDYFSESYGGGGNISGYTSKSETSIVEEYIEIPFHILLKSKEEVEKSVKMIAENDKVLKRKQKDDEELIKLRKRIAQLEAVE